MKKKIIISIISGVILFAGAGCKKFLDVNSDPAGADKVDDNLLLAGVQIQDAFNISGGFPAKVTSFWTQQLSYMQTQPNWESYKVIAADWENTWAYNLYPGALKNLKMLEAQANVGGHAHYEGIAKILIAFNLAHATDLWNAVPYSDGFKGLDNITPKYDSQESIYQTIFTLLDDAIKLLQGANTSVVKPDAKDLVYGKFSGAGTQVDHWIKFAWLLKARYSLRLINAPDGKRTARIDDALAAVDKSFPDASYNAGVKFATTSGNEAPWFQFINNWGSTVMAATLIDMLKKSQDPRLEVMATTNEAGEYVGHVNGVSEGQVAEFSGVGDFFTAADQTVFFGTYDELLFIKAEATYLKSGFSAAQSTLDDAVKATMTRYGLDPNSQAVADYLDANCKLTAANAYNVIMTEKYISNFLSIEAFNDWRRTNLPVLNVANNAYLNMKAVPRRFLYPGSELETNPQPQQPGAMTERVWWDTKQ